MQVLHDRGVGLAHNPESNMKLASGVAAVTEWLARGLRAGLGTDGAASNNDLDMFEAMRMAALLQKVTTMDPRALPARQALELATRRGAEALGLGDRIGSLEAGKQADLITVAMDGARQTPMFDAMSHLVYVIARRRRPDDDRRRPRADGRTVGCSRCEPATCCATRGRWPNACARRVGTGAEARGHSE